MRRKEEIAEPIQEQEVRKIKEQVSTPFRLQEIQVQGRPQQVQTPLRIQGKEEIQVQVRPQQVQTSLRQAQMLRSAKSLSEKLKFDLRGNRGRLNESVSGAEIGEKDETQEVAGDHSCFQNAYFTSLR